MRNSNKIKRNIFILLLINFYHLFAQDKTIIQFEDYIILIKEKLPELKKNTNDLSIAKNNVFKANELYDVDLYTSFNGIGNKIYPDGSSIEMDYSSGFNTKVELSTTFPSGTRLSVGGEYTQMYSNGESSQTIWPGGFQNNIESEFNTISYDPVIKLGISQPLIFNWFGFLDRFAKKDAKMKLVIEKLKKIENDKQILNYYEKLYFIWVEYNEMLRFLEKTIENSKQLEEQTKEKLKTGIAENDELQRVKYLVFKYKEQYNQVEAEYYKIMNELSMFFETKSTLPDITTFDTYFQNSIDQTVDFIEFEKTRNSKILNLSKENLEYMRKASFNKTLPQLNLFGNLDIKFHRFDQTIESDAEDPETSYGDIDFVAGLEFRYPLGNYKARGELKETELMIKDLLLQYDITNKNYTQNLKTIISYINVYKKIVAVKKQSIDSLKSRYKTEKKKYNQARVDLRDLLDTDNTITSEEIELIKLKTNIINLYFDYVKFTR
ncbi:MAG: TolC family protein [Spirochaetes bacterium]|nr:TolC family protein [Spirochaetota bacterium]